MTEYAHIRAAFHGIALALMSWQEPAVMGPREYRNREQLRDIWKPIDKQGETEPFDIEADWKERT